jgi:predicted nucleic acid-binding protein
VKTVLDTNITIYLLGGKLAHPLPDDDHHVSIITEIELLSYPTLTADEEQRVVEFLATVTIIGLTPVVRDAAIRLRRDHRLRVPDAIIAGTALALDAELLTNDARLARVPGIRCRRLRLSDT